LSHQSKIVDWGVGILLRRWILILLCLSGIACGGGEEASLPPSAGASATLADKWVTTIDTVRTGDTFNTVLLRNRLYLRDIGRVVQEIRATDLFSLRRIKPGDQVMVSVDFDGRLRQLQYQKSPDQVYVLDCCADSVSSYRTGLAYDIYLRKLAGSIETTVYEVLHSAGGDDRLVYKLSDIFESDIDFITEPRPGDRLSLLVEEKRYKGEWIGHGDIVYAAYEGKKVTQTAICFVPEDDPHEEARFFTPSGESLVRVFLRSPLNFRRISSSFSRNRLHPILRVYRPHLGVDYAAPAGTPVVAIGDGVVNYAGWNGGFGRFVRIRHGSVYETSYGHFTRIAKGIKKNSRVKRGQVIGYVGSTGLATGPHLDYRVKRHGEFIDPLRMENPPAEPLKPQYTDQFQSQTRLLAAIADSLASGQVMLWHKAPVDSSRATGGTLLTALEQTGR
jgi:murein DD-endopeptidase MepM/ murein hydrolase activator NlpD